MMHICSYIYKVSDFRPSICSCGFFFFLFEQDCYYLKVAFVSSRFENPLEYIVFLDGIQLKTQNTTFKSFMGDKTVPQYRYYPFSQASQGR